MNRDFERSRDKWGDIKFVSAAELNVKLQINIPQLKLSLKFLCYYFSVYSKDINGFDEALSNVLLLKN